MLEELGDDEPKTRYERQECESSKEKTEFIVTDKQIERWKKMKPTEKIKNLLLKKGFSEEDLKYIKTQYEAHVILNNLKEENI